MATPPPSQLWQHGPATPPSSNQQNWHRDSSVVVFAAKKQVDDSSSRAIVAKVSPELESSARSIDGLYHEHEESEGESEHEIRASNDESHELLLQRYNQLQDDVEVLASHLENQERAQEQEREETVNWRLELQQKNAVLDTEVRGLRTERDALQKQNVLLVVQHEQSEQQANAARETHEEMVYALTQQQQQYEALQASVVSSARSSAEAWKALDRAQMHCRRLEEELATAHAQVLHLQNERDTLQAVLASTASGTAGHEARQLELRDEMIASLRADLLQVEFEFKTLTVDKAALEEQTEKLQKRVARAEHGAEYEVVPLGNGSTRKDKEAKRKGQKKRTTIRPVQSNANHANRRGSDLFNNVMELPNAVTDPSEGMRATIWLSPPTASYFSSSSSSADQLQSTWSLRDRIAPPTGIASFVAKTVQSARKHLTTPLQKSFVSPH
ncbi:hypothetical protein BBJ28_00009153 [Nothophytophthora sp. Chile5]|nr:hypothetical protein BBJ28_00009153 [Nothophytophthora sp. Chile5]